MIRIERKYIHKRRKGQRTLSKRINNYKEALTIVARFIEITIPIITLFFVIIPGKELIEKELEIKEISKSNEILANEKNRISKEVEELNMTSYVLQEEIDKKNRNISELQIRIDDYENFLFNAEITVLISDFKKYTSSFHFKRAYDSSIGFTMDFENFEEVSDNPQSNYLPKVTKYRDYNEIDRLIYFYENDPKESEIYKIFKEIYSDQYLEIVKFVESFELSENVRESTYNVFINYIISILEDHRNEIRIINDVNFLIFERNWINFYEFLKPLQGIDFISYGDLLSLFNEDKEEYFLRKNEYDKYKDILFEINTEYRNQKLGLASETLFRDQRHIISTVIYEVLNNLYRK